MFVPGKVKDDVTNTSVPEYEKGKTIAKNIGGQMIYQNGNKKSDVAVIDIIEDGKS